MFSKNQLRFLGFALLLAGVVNSVFAFPLLNGLGGPRGYGELAMSRNDDRSSQRLSLPFEINFFGSSYDSFFINNNGNITFNLPVGAFTPQPFPIAAQPMIAPYWADVDTRGTTVAPQTGPNNVWVASPNSSTVVVTWDLVGYYHAATNKLNNFQLILRDRSADTGTPGDFDVEFRYDRLEWTTGDASGGSNGLGGIPAQAGYDAGNGVDFFVLPGSRTSAVLDLQNTSNVSPTTPGLWSFAIRNGALPGSTPDNPLLPVIIDGSWNFEFGVNVNETVFIDPEVAIGYDYVINSGPNFQSVVLPSVGDDLFEIWLWGGSDYDIFGGSLAAGDVYIFGSGGVDRFRVLGIEVGAGLDPNDVTAFVTGLTFTTAGIVNMTQTPITTEVVSSVPEPSVLVLMGIGLIGVAFGLRWHAG